MFMKIISYHLVNEYAVCSSAFIEGELILCTYFTLSYIGNVRKKIFNRLLYKLYFVVYRLWYGIDITTN